MSPPKISKSLDSLQYPLFDNRMKPVRHFCGNAVVTNRESTGPRIYVASRTIHASKWLQLREEGVPIVSTWIDEAGVGQSRSLSDLAKRCIDEAASCTHFILYCERGELLKGALLECGAALANNRPVYCIGHCSSISRVFENHPCWHSCDSLEDALSYLSPDPSELCARFVLPI
jgi:hypothetical protein